MIVSWICKLTALPVPVFSFLVGNAEKGIRRLKLEDRPRITGYQPDRLDG